MNFLKSGEIGRVGKYSICQLELDILEQTNIAEAIKNIIYFLLNIYFKSLNQFL